MAALNISGFYEPKDKQNCVSEHNLVPGYCGACNEI
jgi:hypothetical protein